MIILNVSFLFEIYFIYKYHYLDVDEDGELITVQQDEDLNGFVASFADFDNPLHVHLGEWSLIMIA